MIDLHCHIVPGVDDGAENLEIACQMAFQAWELGTDIVVATPHFNRPDQKKGTSVRDLKIRFRRFRDVLRDSGCPLRLYSGMEMFATARLPRLLDQGEFLTLAGSRYLLMEFFFDEHFAFMNKAISAVMERGLIPVIAHPERYAVIQEQPERVAQWFHNGVVIQLNKGTILGRMGNSSERTAWWLLRHNLAHIVASDAHSVGIRNPNLDELARVLSREVSPAYTAQLVQENPDRILHDCPLQGHPAW